MKNTYYTPELEEFCLGFECEYYNRETEVWEKLTIDTIKLQLNECNYYLFYDKEGNKRDNYTFLSEASKFRVKCLDSQDVEELGFKLVWNDTQASTFALNEWVLNLSGNRVVITNNTDELAARRFNGTIRNKSELKTLLKQIDIT